MTTHHQFDNDGFDYRLEDAALPSSQDVEPENEQLSYGARPAGNSGGSDLEQPVTTLRTLIQPYALPAQPTPPIGRNDLITRLADYLDGPDRRLLTLLGPGGVGKTRLACEIARRRERTHEIVRFVDLSHISDSAHVLSIIHEALEPLQLFTEPLSNQNLIMLGNPRTLLVLDNFEHVIDAAPELAETLADAPWLQIIVTSRIPLRLRWEHICVVPPLATPPNSESADPASLATIPSVDLFTTFVRQFRPDFVVNTDNARAISEICRRLDGLPLALELAAADMRVMTIERLLQRIDRPLDTLVRGPRDLPERQQTMRATIEWSYALLSSEHQQIVRQLAVFAGSGTLAAVADVLQIPVDAAYDTLVAIAEQNLFELVDGRNGEPRFQMRQMDHEYLAERLAEDAERSVVRDRFVAYYSRLAAVATANLSGRTAEESLDTLRAERDNFQSIMRLADDEQYRAASLELALTLMPFWVCPGHLAEGRRSLERLLALTATDDRVRANVARVSAARLAVMAGDLGAAHQLLVDARLDSDPLASSPEQTTVLAWSCYVRLLRGDVPGAAYMLETSPELREAGTHPSADICNSYLRALIAVEREEHDADNLLNEALKTVDLIANHAHAIDIVCMQADRALIAGDVGGAAQRFTEALVRAKVAGNARGRVRPLLGLGDIAGSNLTTDEALHHFREAFEIARDHHDERALIQVLERVAVLGVSSRIVPNLLRLIGFADLLRARLDVGRSTFDQRWIVPKLDHARQLLGQDEYNRIRAEGESLSLAQVHHEIVSGASKKRVTPPTMPGKRKPAPLTIDQLTRREREVVQQISKGHSNRQIAANLGMAERTVDSHIGNIRQKLQIPSRAQIAVWAVANGLSSPD